VDRAGLARLLAGVAFPRPKRELLAHARRRRERVRNPDLLLAALRTLPDREYASLADVRRALGQVR